MPDSLTLEKLETPCLVLDAAKMDQNIARLTRRLAQLGVSFRPHLKTPKSIEVAWRVMPSLWGPATVSTLREAEEFADAGVRDLLYAIGISPAKLDRVVELRRRGTDLAIILDSLDQVSAVIHKVRESGHRIPVLIEIDSDGHRAGLQPDNPLLIEIGRELVRGGAELRGVMTHAGGAYSCSNVSALEEAAEHERAAAVAAAEALRAAGLPCPIVSVGSTPTAHFARDLNGVTEVRAGVFMYFDLVMAGIGVCGYDDIAVSVLATVIGHQREKGWVLLDAGWMALSADRGTARQSLDQGYGLVCDIDGAPYRDLIVAETSQEHGIVALRPGSSAHLPGLAIGARVRILPNHACATAAQHDSYHVIASGRRTVEAIWPRFRGW
jgi:D-serine deaminase-like pyridoxal phosphate-dependent protein